MTNSNGHGIKGAVFHPRVKTWILCFSVKLSFSSSAQNNRSHTLWTCEKCLLAWLVWAKLSCVVSRPRHSHWPEGFSLYFPPLKHDCDLICVVCGDSPQQLGNQHTHAPWGQSELLQGLDGLSYSCFLRGLSWVSLSGYIYYLLKPKEAPRDFKTQS